MYSVTTFSFNETVIRTRSSHRIPIYCNSETNVYHILSAKRALYGQNKLPFILIYNDDLSVHYDTHFYGFECPISGYRPNKYMSYNKFGKVFGSPLERTILRSNSVNISRIHTYDISLISLHYRDVSLGTILLIKRTKMNMSQKCHQYIN